MPELAEVELSRRIWDTGRAESIERVTLHPRNRIFRGLDPEALARALTGRRLQRSIARGKQLAFVFAKPKSDASAHWLGIHLGMAGSLHREPAESFQPGKHDHLVLWGQRHALVFRDVRHFGRVLSHAGADEPAWWSAIAPDLTSPAFTLAALAAFLQRRKNAPLKAVLLMQERFPGVGNWLADEILWCARLHPATRSGTLSEKQRRTLWREIRRVCRETIRQIDEDWNYPKSWLFQHRWRPGGKCPRCRATLARDTIGGRTTCWCPRCQPAEKTRRRRKD
jgi:formamidopyrimidine-DNA glycosylase